jgi:hypothetical protein
MHETVSISKMHAIIIDIFRMHAVCHKVVWAMPVDGFYIIILYNTLLN